MKHILILLAILLLSSPLFGQETGVLYLWERSSGSVWKTFGDEDTQLKYNGKIKNGKQEGAWIWYWSYGRLRQKGEYRNGKREGPWVWYNPDGAKNESLSGTYRNGVKVSD